MNGNGYINMARALLKSSRSASLGKTPAAKPLTKLREVVASRKWFMAYECRDPEEAGGVGFGFCLKALDIDKDEYIIALLKDWEKSDDKIKRMVDDRFKMLHRFKKGNRPKYWPSTVLTPDPSTWDVCRQTRVLLEQCQELYNG